jgi:hypothetical protein
MNMRAYRTEDLPFAAFLYATRKLRFLACEPVNGSNRIAFAFADNDGTGERLHVEFESGAECPAAVFYDSIRHLRRVMDRTRSREQNAHETRHR